MSITTMFATFGKKLPILSRVLLFLRSAQLEQQTSDKAKYACKRHSLCCRGIIIK